jgi:type IV secretory pathway TraG/TraD family ATPase VirD4
LDHRQTYKGIPLLTAQDIKQLRDEDIIGFHRLLPPFRAKRMDWRNFPMLSERQAMTAPQLAMLPLLDEKLPMLAFQQTAQFPNGFIDPDI